MHHKFIDTRLTCCQSHAFCLDCVQRLHLIRDQPAGQTVVCPACHSTLPRGQDVIVSNLHPYEDYKSTALSGLSPSIVLECAERALSFWAYQKTQEIYYQRHLHNALSEKYSRLKSQFNQTIGDANMEIVRLQKIIDSMCWTYLSPHFSNRCRHDRRTGTNMPQK